MLCNAVHLCVVCADLGAIVLTVGSPVCVAPHCAYKCCAPLCFCVLHAQSWERLFWLTEQLQLREEQRLAITAGCEVFKRLLDRVIEARQALLKQQAAQAGVRLPNGRSADLETEQQMVKQLQRLERQEQFLVIFATLFVVCVLDVVQLARATVLVWPFVPHFHLLGTAMMKRKAAAAATAQQQGQQQQRQQPVQNRCRPG